MNNDRLCVLLKKYSSDTGSTGFCDGLLAYTSHGDHDAILAVSDDSSTKAVFENVNAHARFYNKERRVIMA